MNDTNNVNNNNPNEVPAPVAPVVEQPTPAASTPVAPAPVAPAPAAPVEQQIPVAEKTDNIDVKQGVESPKSEEPKKDENKSENVEEYVDETVKGKKRFPFAIVIIIVALILLAIFYYFFWITPAKVFDKAINNIVESIKDTVSGMENSEHDVMSIGIDTKLVTAGPNTINDQTIFFVNDLEVGANIIAKMKDFDFGVMFNSNLQATEENMEYSEPLDIGVDYVDNNIYIKSKASDKVARYSAGEDDSGFSLDYSRITDAVEAFEMMKDKVLVLVDDDKLDRHIVVKKIKALEDTDTQKENNQTALAIKVHTKLNYDEIKDIYDKGFSQLYDNEEYINKISNAFALTTDEAKEFVNNLVNRTTVTENIEINLYMNLANSQLIGLDVTVDKYYFELNYLNGYYYIDLKIHDDDNETELFDIEASYDNYYGVLDLNAEVTLEDQTYLNADVVYKRTTSDNSLKMTGNTLDFKFYGETEIGSGIKADKPFCTFNCILSIAYDDEVDYTEENLVNPQDAVELTDLSGKEITNITETLEKILYEYFFVYGRLFLNREYTNVKEYSLSKVSDIKDMVSSVVASAAGSITYDQLVEMTLDELKEKMEAIKDLDEEQKASAYESIVNNIKSALTYDEINKLEYDTAKELLGSKLALLDKKYQTEIYNAITDVMVKAMTYEKITTMTLEEEQALLKKANLLPESNQKTIFTHIIDEVKANVTYDKILSMTLEEEKDLLSRVNVLPSKYKTLAYTEITSIITSNLKYDEIVAMSNEEINTLMDKIEVLPSANQKTILAKVADVINKKVTYAYMLDLKLADEKTLLAKVELLPNKSTIYANIGNAVVKGLTAKEMASLETSKIEDLLAKVELLPASTQKTINAQIVKASKELMANTTKYNVTVSDLLPKVCKLPNDTVKAIVGADKSAICTD